MPKVTISARINKEIKTKIEKEFLNGDYLMTDFVFDAVYEKLQQADSFNDVIISSSKLSLDLLNKLDRDNNLIFSFINHFTEYFLLYHKEIPESLKADAIKSAISRHDNFLAAFKTDIEENNKTTLYDLFSENKNEKK